ncbi:MAG TPA: hypothetical protein VGL40_04215, partial [Bacillota bacterium]
PELGTIAARQIPMVVLTSNSERELSDGLKRRCVYLHIDFPSVDKEIKIINVKVPEIGPRLSDEIARTVNYLRFGLAIKKRPSIAETLDWARALLVLDADRLNDHLIGRTANLLLKNKEDLDVLQNELQERGIMSRIDEFHKAGGGLAAGLKPGTTLGAVGTGPAPKVPSTPGGVTPTLPPSVGEPGTSAPAGAAKAKRGGSPFAPPPPRRTDPR